MDYSKKKEPVCYARFLQIIEIVSSKCYFDSVCVVNCFFGEENEKVFMVIYRCFNVDGMPFKKG